MSAPDPQIRITQLERELHWAQLKFQVLEERLASSEFACWDLRVKHLVTCSWSCWPTKSPE